jgi:hypothetical protein
MSRPAFVSIVLAALTACVAASPALAKLPRGTAFEACGESGCITATGDEAFDASIRLLEPTIEHGDVGPPADAAAWIRVDIVFPADLGAGWKPEFLRPIERGFPVIFVPDGESLGVPTGDGAYRWVPMSPSSAKAYTNVTEGVQPFPAQVLADVDQLAVARADADGESGGTDDGEGDPALLIVVAGAIAVFLAGTLAYRGTHLRRTEA